jgi:hypothetical protein
MFNPYGVARHLVFVLPRPALRLVRVIHIAHLRRAKGKNILMILPWVNTALKLKDEEKVPYSQIRNRFFFYSNEVDVALRYIA